MSVRYVDVPGDAQSAFCLAWEALTAKRNENGVQGEWYWSHCEGVVVVRLADMAKFPEHDKGPERKAKEHGA